MRLIKRVPLSLVYAGLHSVPNVRGLDLPLFLAYRPICPAELVRVVADLHHIALSFESVDGYVTHELVDLKVLP
jgi:hypothetical protein